MPEKIERRRRCDADVLDVARHQHDADEPDRHVDEEDPVPGEVGGDEAADRRPNDRADQGRHGHPHHGAEQCAAVDGAHQDEAADRRHHGAADALHDARHHEPGERARERAADRACDEHRDGGAEHRARAEPVGGPAARRDEDGEREQVAGDGELERERAGADIGRDRRQRGGDHGRVHVLHEQRDRNDKRHQAVGGHGHMNRHARV